MVFRTSAAAVLLTFAAVAPAASQSAAETALVISSGLETGLTARNQAGDPVQRYEKLGDDPFVLRGVRLQSTPGLSDTDTRVAQSDPCRYVVVTTWTQDRQNEHHDFRAETTIDLTDAGPAAFIRPYPDANPKSPPGMIDFPGAKMVVTVTKDGEPLKTPPGKAHYATQERLNRAVAHMKKTYCPGAAK